VTKCLHGLRDTENFWALRKTLACAALSPSFLCDGLT
jgi:hypothetical protein